MGTWGIGPFENDTAADFAGTLDETPAGGREELVRSALSRVAGTDAEDYLDCDEAVEAVAAAALIAAQCRGGEPVSTSYGPDEALPVFAAELRPLAVDALDRIVSEESELAELWDETDEGPDWRQDIGRLRAVLDPAPAVPDAPLPGL
ncbi:DUF4259 domain-containing protein [Kitasatospora sp. NBC_00458]|uniref:DUF4259 domain-containing protein n=1 Tax=Kitasatospora sp. NBC_00458 TaxID=2903568 RepID=UPI002E1955C5